MVCTVLMVPGGSAQICTHAYFRAVSVTFHPLLVLFSPGANIHLGWSQLVRQDRLLFTHTHRKCVFCDHLWVLSSGRSLKLWLVHCISMLLHVDEVHLKNWWAFSLMIMEFVFSVFVLVVEIFQSLFLHSLTSRVWILLETSHWINNSTNSCNNSIQEWI